VVIATKFGWRRIQRTEASGLPSIAGQSTSRKQPRAPQAAQDDVIDLYYQHRVDPNVPIEDVAGAVKT